MKWFIFAVLFQNILCSVCQKKYRNQKDCIKDYGELGVFTTAYPWSYIKRIPWDQNDPLAEFEIIDERPAINVESPDEINTTFLIFSEEHSLYNPFIFDPMESVDALRPECSGYRSNTKTLIFIHGWLSGTGENGQPDEQIELLVKEVEKMTETINLIFVDWSKGAEKVRYWQPATNTEIVGAQVGRFIMSAISEGLNTIDDFYLAGHSLGAHVAAYAGKFVQQANPSLIIPRITGTKNPTLIFK